MPTPRAPARFDYSPAGGRQFEQVERSLKGMGDAAISNGHAVEVELTTSPQSIAHGLGRQYLGWFFISKSTIGDAFETGDVDETRYISLQGSVVFSATIWVF